MRYPFEQAVARHGPTVLRVCRAALGPGPDAEDAWSETFIAALKAWPGLPQDTNLEAWLVRVAQRRTVDILRVRSREAIPTQDLPERPRASGAPSHDDRELWRAVAALPERQRLALAYHYFGGLPHAETAKIIGGTADAVRRASADGLKSLRRTYRAGDEPKGAS